MKINGMGNVTKKEIMSVLTKEAEKSIAAGDLTWEEAGEMYKLECVKKHSKIGRMNDTFSVNYKKIPEQIYDKLPPEDIAQLVDILYDTYNAEKEQ